MKGCNLYTESASNKPAYWAKKKKESKYKPSNLHHRLKIYDSMNINNLLYEEINYRTKSEHIHMDVAKKKKKKC